MISLRLSRSKRVAVAMEAARAGCGLAAGKSLTGEGPSAAVVYPTWMSVGSSSTAVLPSEASATASARLWRAASALGGTKVGIPQARVTAAAGKDLRSGPSALTTPRPRAASPLMTNTGRPDLAADSVPCTALAMAGPRPTRATPSRPVAAAWPMAAITAWVSWRTPITRTPMASRVANNWQMSSLIRPNTVSTPRSFRSWARI